MLQRRRLCGKFCRGLRDHALKIINYEEKEMIMIKKVSLLKSKKFVTYTKKNLVLMKMIKMQLNYAIMLVIIVITPENLAELLIVFAI